MAQFARLPGNFAKLTNNGRTIARVHAFTDGTWQGSLASHRETFASEASALAWLESTANALGFDTSNWLL